MKNRIKIIFIAKTQRGVIAFQTTKKKRIHALNRYGRAQSIDLFGCL